MRTRVLLLGLCALTSLAPEASAEPPAPAPAPAPARTATPGTVRFAAVGDIMTHWIQIQAAWKPSCKCHDFAPMFADARALLEDADVTFGNLETTMPGDPRRYTPKGTVLFGAPDSLADAVAGAGFDVVATANNHAADTGGEGVKNTLAQLDRVGVLHAGSWPTPEARVANPVLRFEKNGLRIAMVAYSYGSNEGKPDGAALATLAQGTLEADVRSARAGADVVIVSLHFGEQYERKPNKKQREFVGLALAAGADVVLGHHPHVLQPIERIEVDGRSRLVAWSLGNFVANYRMRYTDGGIVLGFTLEKGAQGVIIKDVGYRPVYVHVEKDGPDAPRFRILPALDYLTAGRLPASAHKALQQFVADTAELLGPATGLTTASR